MPPVPVGLVGLGLMGAAMTATLRAAGHQVVGHDPDPARREHFASLGGTAVRTLADVLDASTRVILSLPNSSVAQRVCLGPEGIAARASVGTLVIDTTTGRPEDAVTIANGLAEVGVGYLDATISGNADQTRVGDIVMMVGGDAEHFQEVGGILEALARGVHHLGPSGSGASTKLIVNLILGVHRVVLAEGLVLGEKLGLDTARLLQVLQDGAAYSRAMEIWGPRMVSGRYEPPASRIKQNHKDFGLILDLGRAAGSPTLLASTVSQLLGVAKETGLADADNSAVAALMRRLAGLPQVPGGDGTSSPAPAETPGSPNDDGTNHST